MIGRQLGIVVFVMRVFAMRVIAVRVFVSMRVGNQNQRRLRLHRTDWIFGCRIKVDSRHGGVGQSDNYGEDWMCHCRSTSLVGGNCLDSHPIYKDALVRLNEIYACAKTSS